MRWLSITASLAIACVSVTGGTSARAGQSSTSSTSAASAKLSSASASHKKSKKHHSKHVPMQKAPTPDRISEIQSALSRGGYYQGDPNGKLDSNTVAALQKFQSANGMEANGKLDAPTLQKLGLGSDIAGVSAPRPVMPNCCAMSPSATPPASSPATASARSNVSSAPNAGDVASPPVQK